MSGPTFDTDDFRGSFPRRSEEAIAWHADAPRTEVLEPALPIVDPHHHLFGAPTDAIHYRLEDLERDLAGGHAILGTVYVEAYESGWRKTGPVALRPVGEVEMIAGLTAAPLATPRGPCQVAAGIVAHADLTLGDGVVNVLEQEISAAQGRLRGVRHRTATDDGTVGRFLKDAPKPRLMGEPSFRRGFAHLARLGFPYDAWLYHTQIAELAELADAFPDATIVLNHAGTPMGVAEWRGRRTQVLAEWERDMRALAERPNVCVKVGGMGMIVFGFGFERRETPPTAQALVAAWQPFIDVCIDAFGSRRCMFESNFPPDQQSCSYGELWNAFKLATRERTEAERRDLFYRTACRIYRLPELMQRGDSVVW